MTSALTRSPGRKQEYNSTCQIKHSLCQREKTHAHPFQCTHSSSLKRVGWIPCRSLLHGHPAACMQHMQCCNKSVKMDCNFTSAFGSKNYLMIPENLSFRGWVFTHSKLAVANLGLTLLTCSSTACRLKFLYRLPINKQVAKLVPLL